uniref:Ribosome biogenesis protein BOP1 homolog n=1 Tax=Plectus sambesii TaxID=2011161 RepID=A0A914XED7_9BILA
MPKRRSSTAKSTSSTVSGENNTALPKKEDDDTDEDEEKLKSRLFAEGYDDDESDEGDNEEDDDEEEDTDEDDESDSEDDDDDDELLRESSDDDHDVVYASERPSHSKSHSRRNITADTCDSSDEEDLRNTIGNIPVSWYDDQDHIGYDWEGTKIGKPAKKSEIDQFLEKVEDPDYWRKVRDKQTGQDVVLTDEQIATLMNIQRGRYPTIGYNPYQPFVDFVSSQHEIHPISNRPEDKRSFVPSADERRMVGRMVHAIKMGWAKPKKVKPTDEEVEAKRYYDLWTAEESEQKTKTEMARIKMHFPAPKVALPGHDESYNPPPEYLLSPEELKRWEETEPEDRRRNFIPQKFPSLREVPAYARFINERFDRCLDLYLAHRQQKTKLDVDPKDLLPELPRPQDLHPFPTTLSLLYKGHTGMVRALSMEPSVGQLMASGSDDGTVRVWEIGTGRCVKTLTLGAPISSLMWCPNAKMALVAAASANNVFIINIECGDRLVVSETLTAMNNFIENSDQLNVAQASVTWSTVNDLTGSSPAVSHLKLTFETEIKQVTWHAKGDYFATVTSNGARSVVVHQLSKLKSQAPFQKNKGSVQTVAFHQTRPLLFVATQKHVRVYNLATLQLAKKLLSNIRWISSIAIHPKGDNLIIGGYDCRLTWFDLDLSTKPYKTFRHHKSAVRSVAYHPHYPLFASSSDDGSVMVYHGRVYSDLLQNPQIVPVKILRGHKTTDGLCVLSCAFHPKQPWLVTAGADSTLALYTY